MLYLNNYQNTITMNREYIKIKETGHQEFIVEARLVDGNLWINPNICRSSIRVLKSKNLLE